MSKIVNDFWNRKQAQLSQKVKVYNLINEAFQTAYKVYTDIVRPKISNNMRGYDVASDPQQVVDELVKHIDSLLVAQDFLVENEYKASLNAVNEYLRLTESIKQRLDLHRNVVHGEFIEWALEMRDLLIKKVNINTPAGNIFGIEFGFWKDPYEIKEEDIPTQQKINEEFEQDAELLTGLIDQYNLAQTHEARVDFIRNIPKDDLMYMWSYFSETMALNPYAAFIEAVNVVYPEEVIEEFEGAAFVDREWIPSSAEIAQYKQ